MFKEPDETGYKMPIGKNRVHADKEAARKAHIERVKVWNKENPEKFKEYQKNYYESVKDTPEYKEKCRQKYLENKEKINQRAKDYYHKMKNNPEYQEKCRQYYQENKERINAKRKEKYNSKDKE